MIVSIKSGVIPKINGVILIDCWDYSNMPDIHQKKKILVKNFYQNIINNLKKFQVRFVVNAMTQVDINQVDQQIRDQLLNKIEHCNIQSWKDFLTCNTKSVDQWYVAGQTWNYCVHNNDIGLKNMSQSSHNNFYADQFSFMKESCELALHDDFSKDSHSWQYLKWFGYKLL